MELKTIKEFAHKSNLGSGLTYENGVFKATVNLDGYLHKNNLGEGLAFSNNKVNVDLDDEFNTIATSLNQLNTKVTQLNEQLGTVYKVQGSTTVEGINSISVDSTTIGYVYNLLDSGTITQGIGGSVEVEAGDNVVYTENGWDKLSATSKMTLEAGGNITVEGNKISALGYKYDAEKNSFSVGNSTATGQYSYAEGCYTKATAFYAHAEGEGSKASSQDSHAEGDHTTAAEYASHAEGSFTTAYGSASHAEGYKTITNNEAEHAEGKFNKSNKTSDDFGNAGNTIHSIGIGSSEANKNAQEVMQNGDFYVINVGGYDGTTITEAQTLQEVISNKVDKEEGKGLSTEDYTTEEKTKLNSIEEGAQVNIQSDWNQSDETLKDYIKNKPDLTVYQLKEEGKSLTSNNYTTEEKEKLSGIEDGAQVNTVNSVNGQTGNVVIEQLTAGNNINIENNVITAKGYSTDTTNYTFATGYDTNAIDVYTHAEGFGTKAQGSAAHAEGCKTVTTNAYEHAQGGYNLSNTGENQSDKTLHSIGIGDGEENRKNAHEVMQNGDTYIIGIGGYIGTNPTEAKTLQEVIAEILSKLS